MSSLVIYCCLLRFSKTSFKGSNFKALQVFTYGNDKSHILVSRLAGSVEDTGFRSTVLCPSSWKRQLLFLQNDDDWSADNGTGRLATHVTLIAFIQERIDFGESSPLINE